MKCNFRTVKEMIINELNHSLALVDEAEVKTFIEVLMSAGKVFVIGVGRSMLMMQAFAKRLNHIGIEAFYVGEINEPAIRKEDVLIVGSGSGETVVPVAICKVAIKYSPTIVHLGSNMNSTISNLSSIKVRIPCKTKLQLEDEIISEQPMASLFEQSLLLFLDAICTMIIKEKNIEIDDLWEKHANLE